jgi:hypothetical protein
MFLIAPSASTIGYVFGNFLVIWLIVYAVILGRKRQAKHPEGYYKRILASALIVGALYLAINQAKIDSYGWKAAVFGVATLAALFVNVVDTWRPCSGIRIKALAFVGNSLAVLIAIILSSYAIAAAYENATSRREFVEGLRRGMATNPSADILGAVLDTAPDLYDKFLPYMSNDRLRGDRASFEKASGEIFGGYISDASRRMDDATIAKLLSLNAEMMLAAYAEAPAICIQVQNSGTVPAQARTPRLQAASKAYASAIGDAIRAFHAAPMASPKPPEQQVNNLIAQAAGTELLQRFQRTQDPGQQCEIEALVRKQVSALPLPQQAAVARHILIP